MQDPSSQSQEEDRPIGRLFTEIYRERGEARQDDARFRIQLHQAFSELFQNQSGEIARYLRAIAGLEVPLNRGWASGHLDWKFQFTECAPDDLMDLITHLVTFAETQGYKNLASQWVSRVQAALVTRNMAYEVDQKGGVHHKIDVAFQRSTELTLECLAAAKFEAARTETEASFGFLTQAVPDTKMAVVNIFLAAENVFKLVVETGSDLTATSVESQLRPYVQRVFSTADQATNQSSSRLVSSFAAWANACHPYRHGQRDTNLVAPPPSLAIALVTTGADLIRWIVTLP